MKQNLLVFFGGKSCEHDISIITAHQVMDYIDTDKYNIFPIYIDINGIFLYGNKLFNFDFCKDIDYHYLKKIYLKPSEKNIYYVKDKILCNADVALLCMHGLNGEDGSLQGLLELSGIPYTSSSILGSALGMDKIATKMFLKGMGQNVLPFVWTYKEEYHDTVKKQDFFNRVKKLKYPLIIKPSNLGSSIGITRVNDMDGLCSAMDIAFMFDNRVLIEHAVNDLKEINCSVLGDSRDATASVCERPINWQSFLSFEDKYLNQGSKLGGMDNLKRRLPADIPDETAKEIQNTSIKIFKAMNCKGVIRIDFIIDNADNKIYVNEINTIPGSLSYYLWDYNGIDFFELIDKIVESAKYTSEQNKYLKYSYVSNVLKGSKGKA